MDLNIILIIVGTIIVTTIILTIIFSVNDKIGSERKEYKKQFEEYKQNFVDNKEDIAVRIMAINLLELKEYYIMTKQQYQRTYKVTTFFSSLGCIIIFGGAIYGAVIGDYEIAKYTTISGIVSEAVAALSFWMFTQSKNQLNLYSEQLKDNEKVLCAINLMEKNGLKENEKYLELVLKYLLKIKKETDETK